MITLMDELVDGLPQRLREPIVLCYLQGKKHTHAARELGLTVATIRRRIQSAKTLLRSRFASRGIPVSMFLLHLLMDRMAAGAGSVGTTGPTEVPGMSQVAPRPLSPARLGRLTQPGSWLTKISGNWALTIGLLAFTTGVIPVVYQTLRDDAPPSAAVTDADVPERVIREQAPSAENNEAIAVSSRWSGHAQPTIAPEEPPIAMPELTTGPQLPEPRESSVEPTSESVTVADALITEAEAVPAGPDQPANDVEVLFGIDWHTTVESALAAAVQEPPRPVFCYRVLGELSGFM